MTSVADALARYRRKPTLLEERGRTPFKLVSTVDAASEPGEIDTAWAGREVPIDAADFWATSRGARLFDDVEYGQWGLHLLSPSASAARTDQEREERPSEFAPDDVVLGEFLGDQELLVLAPSEEGQRRILVALPLDGRTDWFAVASDLSEFLERYFDRYGEKYWEP